MPLRGVHVSVRLSVTFMYSVVKSKHIFNFFHSQVATPPAFATHLAGPLHCSAHGLRAAGPSNLVTLIADSTSTKWRRLLIAGNGRRNTTHRLILFMTESIDDCNTQ